MTISRYEESVSGSSSVEDLETAMQLMHLGFTAPRFDSLGLELDKKSRETSIRNRLSDPSVVMNDAFTAIEWGGHPRKEPWTLETLEQLDLEASRRIYQERFANAADFSFLFVGNIELDVLEPLVLRYLGSLPASDVTESKGDSGMRRVADVHKEVVRKGLDEQARVRIRFHGPMEDSFVARHELYSMRDILGVHLREKLREELGGVYGVSVSGSSSKHPESSYSVTVNWSCDPDRVEELKAAALEVIETMRSEGVDSQYVNDEKEKNRRARETKLTTNSYWLNEISWAMRTHREPLALLNYDERNEGLTPNTIQEAARRYLNPEQYIEMVLLPEKQD